jgi:hypothetical protein
MSDNSNRWWELSKENAHEAIFSLINKLDKDQAGSNQDYLDFARLYGNAAIMGLTPSSHYRVDADFTASKKLTLNVIKSCCDTVTAKIAKNKPRPMFLTEGGDYTLQKKAKLLTKFCEGAFYATDLYKKGRRLFLLSSVMGDSWCKFFQVDGELQAEPVHSFEIRIPDWEGFYGSPRQLHQVKTISRDVLLEMYPEHRNAILNANDAQNPNSFEREATDQIQVVESWHLKSGKNATDGRHAISIENKGLVWEPWKRDRFPLVCMKWSERLMGWRGQGLAEELMGIQVEINRILRTITQILRLVVPKLFVEKGSKVVFAHLNNEIGGIVEFTGNKPTYDFLQAIPPDLFNQLERLYARAFEISGISQLSAQSKKPAGLDSGKALREYNDIESERFIMKGLEYEDFFMEAARQFIDIAEEVKEDGGSLKLNVPGRKNAQVIDWNEIDLKRDQYIMQMFPTSFLSSTPSGKLKDIQDLAQIGEIPRDELLKLLDFPDLEGFVSLRTAALEDIDLLIEEMVEKGHYLPPEPYQNLQLGIQKMQSAYLRAKLNKVPEQNLELMRRWMEEAINLVKPEMPMGAPQGPQAPVLANPVQAPTSELLPIEPQQVPMM